MKDHKKMHLVCNVFKVHNETAAGKDICEHRVVTECLSELLEAISCFKYFLLGILLSVHLLD